MELFEKLSDDLTRFIEKQKIFFVGTAPESGRINISPKGMDTLRCLDASTVAYLDLTGSGNETAGHIRENGRLTLMFCGFDAKPLIVRLYGRGEVVAPGDARWPDLVKAFPPQVGVRQAIVLHIESIKTSCGYGVPNYEFLGDKKQIVAWCERKGEQGLRAYREEHNAMTMDGKPTGHREEGRRGKVEG